MNSPPTSSEYSIYYPQQQAETRTESSTTIQSSSIIYLHQQQTESRTISTIPPSSTTSIPDHQKSDDSRRTTTTTLDSNDLIPLPPFTSSSSLSSSSSLETLADAVSPLSPPTSSSPPPLPTPNSPPARHLNPADIRPHLETIDRTAPPPAYRPPPLSRIEAAEILLEIRYGRRERPREEAVELEPEMERSPLPSSRPVKVQVDGGTCGDGAANEGRRGGAVWGSRLRANRKKSLKLAK